MNSPLRVAVLSRSFSRHPVLRAEISARYSEVKFNDTGRTLEGAEIIAFLKGYDGIIVALEKITDALLGELPDLRILSKYGVGLDNVDLRAAARRGVLVGWRGGVNRRSVAELVIGLMIILLRLVPQGNREIREGSWRQLQGRQLSERVIGIIGCGHVGQDLACLLRAFGCRVLAHDIRDFPEFYTASGVIPTALETLLEQSEVVSLHLPVTRLTRNLIDARRLSLMREDAILINAARGGLVDETALKRALTLGKLAGAAFDVFSSEPPEDTELLNLPNFLATPHIGGSAAEAVLAMGRAAIDGLSTAVDPEQHIAPWER